MSASTRRFTRGSVRARRAPRATDWATARPRQAHGASRAGGRAWATMSTTGCGVVRCGWNAARRRRRMRLRATAVPRRPRRRDGQARGLGRARARRRARNRGRRLAGRAAARGQCRRYGAADGRRSWSVHAEGKPRPIPSASGLDGEPLATLTPPAAKNRAPGSAGHAGTKAVLTLALRTLGWYVRFIGGEGRGDKTCRRAGV